MEAGDQAPLVAEFTRHLSARVAGFKLECVAGCVGIRTLVVDPRGLI